MRFEDVDFDVSVVRAGSITHQIIERKMMEHDYKWRQYNNFKVKGDIRSLRVQVVADIPEGREDIIQEAKRILNEHKNRVGVEWNGKELFDYLNDQGITRVRFEDFDCDVSVVRAGSITYHIYQRKLIELDYKWGPQPPALARPRSKDPSVAKSNVYYPLTPIFCIPRDSVEESEWKERFLQSFHVTPVRFRLNEKKLVEGCKKHSVRYIAPQLEDSVDETLRRKYDLNVKLQSSRCRERRRKKTEEIMAENCEAEEMVAFGAAPPNQSGIHSYTHDEIQQYMTIYPSKRTTHHQSRNRNNDLPH